MEFDDYKLAPDNYEEMAKAYYSSLKTCSFEFVKKKGVIISEMYFQKIISEDVYKTKFLGGKYGDISGIDITKYNNKTIQKIK